MQKNWPLADHDPDTFYGGETRGYVDLPTYREEQQRQATQQSIEEKTACLP